MVASKIANCRTAAVWTQTLSQGRYTSTWHQRWMQLATLSCAHMTQNTRCLGANGRYMCTAGASNSRNMRQNAGATANYTTSSASQGAEQNNRGRRPWIRLARPGREKSVALWLIGSAGITAGVMAMGAYVRLNESGLSMIDWQLLGKNLPNDEEEWMREFNKYKTTPEYQQVHYNIDLEEYKNIYINEWIHRMMGRISGLCFGGGALFLAMRGSLGAGGYMLTIAVSALGFSQAFVGKWMVESGFKEPETENKTPRVSPYRLSIHFTNALAIYTLCLWNGVRLLKKRTNSIVQRTPEVRRVRNMGVATLASLFLTILYGTIVAGNDAGLAYNTWPKMLDSYIPDDYANVNSLKHLFEKTGVVQFNHRCLGYVTLLMSLMTYRKSKAPGVPKGVRKLAMGTLHASLLQVIIGIVTVLKHVPLHGAMAHHANAMAVWSMLLMLLARIK